MTLPRCLSFLVAFAFATNYLPAQDPWRVLADGEKSKDARLGKPKTLNGYFPMTVPKTLAEWEKRRTELREQVQVANGLWPMPPKTPLEPVIHGKIERDGYTIEKVYFASLPGHYVCGNLYRPTGKEGKLPAVLCPHGHWANGRFFDAGETEGDKQIKQGAEKFIEGARYPLQARCVQLARMGCVVFFYDMIGYADSKPIKHREGFVDVDAELRLQSFMGLQTWNSIRALDFLLSLPEVDAKRVGVTGASGGGTQTFILGAIDDRPAVAFPAVMVSTAMQGGCICENCSYLRIDAGNIDLAGLFAPRPLAMSGAKDWTVDIETKGLPELKALYRLYGKEDDVLAKCYPEFGHNYNQVSRELMYSWFNRHLKLGFKEPIQEKPFKPVPPAELSVFDVQQPMPKDAASAETVRKYLAVTSDKQLAALKPKDEASLKEYQRVFGTALRSLLVGGLPESAAVEQKAIGGEEIRGGVSYRKFLLGRKGSGEQIPALRVQGKDFDGTVVVWVHADGKRSLFTQNGLSGEARKLLDGKAAILAIDAFETGELKGDKLMPIEKFAGYTFGYNRPLLANRVRDILSAVAAARGDEKTKKLHLVGFDAAGPWVLLARALCGDAVTRTAADVNGFRFDDVKSTDHEMMLPGALKYGGLPALAALASPGELLVHNHRGTGLGGWFKPAYDAAKAADKLHMDGARQSNQAIVDWLLK